MTDAAEQVADIQERARAELSDETVVEGIVRAGTLQQFVDTLTPLVAEAKIHFNDDGLTTTVVDPAGVAMYDGVHLDRAAFESYDAPGQAVIGVDLDTLDERLGPANSDDLVLLAVDMDDASRSMVVQYRNIDQSVALIDPDAVREEPDTSELDLHNEFVIEGRDFAEAVSVCDLVGDHIALRGRPDAECVEFYAEGDTDETTVRFGHDETIHASLADEACESLLTLEYLTEFAKPVPKDAEVTVRFDDEFPIK